MVDMTNGGVNLNANDYKVSVSGLFGRSAKRAANREIEKACGTNNGDVKTNQSKGEKAEGVAEDGEDNADYAIDDGEDGQDVGEDQQVVSENATAEGTENIVTVEDIGALAETNNARMLQLQEECEAGKEELMAQMIEDFQIMEGSMVLLGSNVEEIETITAEIEQLQAEAEGGGFSGDMAAAGGENSAYGLNIPTGAPAPSNQGGGQGGGLLAPAQTAPSNQGGAGGASDDKSGEISAKYARLAEIESENMSLSTAVETAADEAEQLQLQYVEAAAVPIQTEATENNNAGNENLETLAQEGEAFQKITEVGQYTAVAGQVTEAVGVGMTQTGGAVEIAGETVHMTGGLMKGIGAGLKSLGAALLPGCFTAPAGTAVGASGVSVTVSGTTAEVAGTATKATGVAVKGAGVTVQTVGKGIQMAGKATMAVGTAGTTVTNIKNGKWMEAIGSGLSCLGSAISCVGDTAQFVEGIKGAKEAANTLATQGLEALSNAQQKAGAVKSAASFGTKAATVGKATSAAGSAVTGYAQGGWEGALGQMASNITGMPNTSNTNTSGSSGSTGGGSSTSDSGQNTNSTVGNGEADTSTLAKGEGSTVKAKHKKI